MERERERARLRAIKNVFIEVGVTHEEIMTEYPATKFHDVGVSTRLLVEIQSLKENWDLL
jgi:hypothetical protein